MRYFQGLLKHYVTEFSDGWSWPPEVLVVAEVVVAVVVVVVVVEAERW